MNSNPRQILLMTSTIAPKAGVYALKHADPGARLRDYVDAIAHYAPSIRAGVFDRLVYVDNSGWPLDEVVAAARAAGVEERSEFIAYTADAPTDVSRFYLEAMLLKEAAARARVLNESPDDVVWKATGRYRVANIDEIVRTRPARFDLYVNFRDYPEPCCDFYLVAFRRASFEKLFGDLTPYLTTEAGELILRRRIERGDFAGLDVVRRLRRTPHVLGVRGFDGARYDGPTHTAKFWVRALANRVAPWLWV